MLLLLQFNITTSSYLTNLVESSSVWNWFFMNVPSWMLNISVVITLISVSYTHLILTFSISIFDLGERANVKRKEFKKRREISPTIKNEERNDFINVIEKEEKLEPNREEFLKGVNHKIKILDFMKNATIDDELEVAVENNTEKEISSFINREEAMPSVKKEKLDNGIKESVNKEIEDILNEDKEEIEKKEYVFPNTDLLNAVSYTHLFRERRYF